MSGVEAFSGMRMRYTGSGNPSGKELVHTLPVQSRALTAALQREPPQPPKPVSKDVQLT